MFELVSRRQFQLALAGAVASLSGCAERQGGPKEMAQAHTPRSCASQATLEESMEIVASITLPGGVAVLNATVLTLQLVGPDDRALLQRLMAIAQSETETVLLRLDCVDADRRPGAIWEVFVGPPNIEQSAESPHYVGAVALYGDGVRSESSTFASFSLPLDRAITASQSLLPLNLSFEPQSGVVVAGAPTPVQVIAPVRIREIALIRGAGPSP
jgi:hypothetical protein